VAIRRHNSISKGIVICDEGRASAPRHKLGGVSISIKPDVLSTGGSSCYLSAALEGSTLAG